LALRAKPQTQLRCAITPRGDDRQWIESGVELIRHNRVPVMDRVLPGEIRKGEVDVVPRRQSRAGSTSAGSHRSETR
jgi:hypothetical protein